MSRRRAARAILAVVLALVGAVAVAGPSYAEVDFHDRYFTHTSGGGGGGGATYDDCFRPSLSNSVVSGSVDYWSNSEDWYQPNFQPEQFDVSLVVNGSGVELIVADRWCSPVCWTYVYSTSSCHVTSSFGAPLRIGVLALCCGSSTYQFTALPTLNVVTLPGCSDHSDNDNDGYIDYPTDSGCSSPNDATESADPPPALTACSDGADNDGDGYTDYPGDAGCSSPADDTETTDPPLVATACNDGADNDNDGYIDFPGDSGCSSPADSTETTDPPLVATACTDGVDNDGDGRTDFPGDSGCSSPADDTESTDPPLVATECGDGVDNDADGRTDYPSDPGCSSALDTTEGSMSQCPDIAGVTTCASYTSGSIVQQFAVQPPTTTGVPVAGFQDAYQFTLPNGAKVTLPCIVLITGTTVTNPCASAGGAFVRRDATLVTASAPVPTGSVGLAIAYVRVCNAELELTVNGFGIDSFPAYAVC